MSDIGKKELTRREFLFMMGLGYLSTIFSYAFIGVGTKGIRQGFKEFQKETDRTDPTKRITKFDPIDASAEELKERYDLTAENAEKLNKLLKIHMNHAVITGAMSAALGDFYRNTNNTTDIFEIKDRISNDKLSKLNDKLSKLNDKLDKLNDKLDKFKPFTDIGKAIGISGLYMGAFDYMFFPDPNKLKNRYGMTENNAVELYYDCWRSIENRIIWGAALGAPAEGIVHYAHIAPLPKPDVE